jgi:uroporphyrin-3 C-methyltransferase/uroporphyrinogen III methyltransferase/synthase
VSAENEIPATPDRSTSEPSKPERSTPETGAPAEAPPRRSASAGILGGVALLIALLAAAAVLFLWQRGEGVAREAARRLQQGDERVAQLEMQVKQGQELVRELQGRSAVLESKLTEALGQQSQLEQMYKSIANESLGATLADVENSVAIASQQLAVSGNVRGALLAMQDADGRLKRINQPEAFGLRRLIAADIERLKAVPNVDVVSLALRLDSVAAGLGQLPMLSSLSPTPADGGAGGAKGANGGSKAEAFSFERLASTGWQGWQALLSELAQLFRVSRVDAPDVVLLAPEQQYFVRENLRLTLLTARFALLAHAEPLFRADLKRAVEWLETYYDKRERSVANAVAALRQLQDARIDAELPSLGDTLAAVRAARASREGN